MPRFWCPSGRLWTMSELSTPTSQKLDFPYVPILQPASMTWLSCKTQSVNFLREGGAMHEKIALCCVTEFCRLVPWSGWLQLLVGYLKCFSSPLAGHCLGTKPSCSNRYQDQERGVGGKSRGMKERRATISFNLKTEDNRSRLLTFAKNRNTSVTHPLQTLFKSLPTW